MRSGSASRASLAADSCAVASTARRSRSRARASWAVWKPPWWSARSGVISGFSAAEFISAASTASASAAASSAGPCTWGKQRNPNGSWMHRPGATSPPSNASTSAATRIDPACGRLRCTSGANGSVDPPTALSVRAATRTEPFRSVQVAATARAAWPIVSALLLISARASPGWKATGVGGGPLHRPSPAMARPSSASGPRSPVPTEPCSCTCGWAAVFSAVTIASAMAGCRPEPPRSTWFNRTASIARTSRSGTGSPIAPAWLRSSRIPCSAESGTGSPQLLPTPVVRPYTGCASSRAASQPRRRRSVPPSATCAVPSAMRRRSAVDSAVSPRTTVRAASIAPPEPDQCEEFAKSPTGRSSSA